MKSSVLAFFWVLSIRLMKFRKPMIMLRAYELISRCVVLSEVQITELEIR
jgi:hypothetical protein